ncbi:MAG TPA: hypothetical protein VFO27_04770 [Bryobacteraceae bacterium]|nr:hypothetical protein [Bryobacteraceae bacterium]
MSVPTNERHLNQQIRMDKKYLTFARTERTKLDENIGIVESRVQQLQALLGPTASVTGHTTPTKQMKQVKLGSERTENGHKNRLSAAGLRRIQLAQKRRWAAARAAGSSKTSRRRVAAGK